MSNKTGVKPPEKKTDTIDDIVWFFGSSTSKKCDIAFREAHDKDGKPPCSHHEWRMKWIELKINKKA
jgi:hypothetical protein